LETGIPARLSPAEGRKFGLTVGGAFLVLAGIIWWRGKHPGLVPYFGGLGGLLVIAGLAIPTALGPVNRAWMGLAHLLSKVTTPIFMGVVYFVVLTPISLAVRLLGKNPLVHGRTGTFWFDRGPDKPEPARMERQF
jgi:Saxitoxin biosynthesis operon protein SxtJ